MDNPTETGNIGHTRHRTKTNNTENQNDDHHGPPPQMMLVSFLLPIIFVEGSCFIYVICIHLRIPVCNTISISNDVRVVWQKHDRSH